MITLRKHLEAKGQVIAGNDSVIIVRNPIKLPCMRGLFPIVIKAVDKTGNFIERKLNK